MQLLDTDRLTPEYCRKPVLVLGCGNPLFGDDGLGPAVVADLQGRWFGALAERACLLDVGTSARTVLFTLVLSPIRPRRLILVDAVDMGRPPGEIWRLNLDNLPLVKRDDFSMHQVPTSNLLRDLRDCCGVDVTIFACQTAWIPNEVATGLSDAIQRAVPLLGRKIVDEVSGHDEHCEAGIRGRRGGSERSTVAQ